MGARCLGGEIVHRHLNPALAVRDAGHFQTHLDAAERAEEHEVVEVAHMADAKSLVGKPGQAGAEPPRSATTPVTPSPKSGCGKPITADSATPGTASSAASTSAG